MRTPYAQPALGDDDFRDPTKLLHDVIQDMVVFDANLEMDRYMERAGVFKHLKPMAGLS